jgi:hypothetical protein
MQAVVDGHDELRIKVPPGYRHCRARVAVTLPEPVPNREAADAQVAPEPPARPLQMGLFRGRIHMTEDFNDPLPDDVWLSGNP